MQYFSFLLFLLRLISFLYQFLDNRVGSSKLDLALFIVHEDSVQETRIKGQVL